MNVKTVTVRTEDAQQLVDIDKASRGKCLWKKLEETPAAA